MFSNISIDAVDLIKKMLVKDPDGRIGLAEALEHPFINNSTIKLNDNMLNVNGNSFVNSLTFNNSNNFSSFNKSLNMKD